MPDDTLIFRTPPFSTGGSAKFLYLDAPRRRILADLIAHVCDGEGPILLVAEPGMGKSTLLDRLAEEANAHNIRLVFSLADVAAIADVADVDAQQTAFLLDDGDGLPLGVWHQLIALLRSAPPTSLGAPSRRLPPIVIALTPDLLNWLFEASLVPRSTPLDRIFRLPTFAPRDVRRFISLRLRVAGVDRPEIFASDSVDRIAQLTDGVPVRINRVCEAALAEAARRGRNDVSIDIVEAAAAAVELETPRPIPPAAPEPNFQPEVLPEPPLVALRADTGPSIGIVGKGYAPVAGPDAVRRRARRRKMPSWAGAAVGVGVAAGSVVAMLSYFAGSSATRPSPAAPAAISSDATATALDSRPVLPPPVGPGLGSASAVPALARPDGQDQRPIDVSRETPPIMPPASGKDTAAIEDSDQSTPPPAGPVEPVRAAPEPVAPVAPVASPAPAKPVSAAKPVPAAPSTERPPQPPRATKVVRGNPAGARTEAAEGANVPSEADAAALTEEEGRPRPVKELIEMGDEFRQAGDTEWARRLYRAAQERGSAKAAVAEAETYDPQYAAASSGADAEKAKLLYSEAARHGDRQAVKRLEELDQWMNERSGR
ncbi:MAG: hypothetical protein U1E42_00725 [Rhodospirillales bacterium]